MGQIVFNGQKSKYCNLQSIQTGGQHVNDDVALGEIWLVDTTNSDKGNSGTGKYDAYIKGDGVKKAGELTLHYTEPKSLSELIEDANHRTVTDVEKAVWNAGGSGGGNPVDNEDLTLVSQSGVNVIKFKDKAYSPATFSGIGRKYLRKNIQEDYENSLEVTAVKGDSGLYEFIEGGFIDISTIAIGNTVTLSPSSKITDATTGGEDITYKFAYCIVDVNKDESFFIQATTSNNNFIRAWGFVDNNNTLLSKSEVRNAKILFGSEIITAPADGKLIVNTYMPADVNYRISKILHGDEKQLNILTQEMFDSPYTAYIVQYDYTLNFNNITLPEGSVLLFDGGSIINGGLIGNNSIFIEKYNRQIFNVDTYLSGSWDNEDYAPEYFGGIGDNTMDCYTHIQKCLDTIHYLSNGQIKRCLLSNTYKITKGLYIYANTHLIGNAINTWTSGVYTINAVFENKMQWIIDSADISYKNWESFPVGKFCPFNMFSRAKAADTSVHYGNPNITIKNVSVKGTITTTVEDDVSKAHYIFGGIRVQRSLHSHLQNVYVSDVWLGIARAAAWYPSDRDLWVSARCISLYYGQDTNQFTLYNGYFQTSSNFNNVNISEYPNIIGQLDKPTNIVILYSKGNLINPITEHGANAYYILGGESSPYSDNKGSNIYISNPYIEGTSYDTFFNIDDFVKCTVLNGVYVGRPRKSFCNTLGTHGTSSNFRLIGFNDITKVASSIQDTTTISYDILHTNDASHIGNFGHKGALAYEISNDKFYMIGKRGATGLDGYNYQTEFYGNTLPEEDSLKIGTSYMLQQSDRVKPIFSKTVGNPLIIALEITNVPSSPAPTPSDNKGIFITFTILGTAYNVPFNYYEGMTAGDIAKQIYYGLRSYFKCFIPYNTTRYHLYILVPYKTYINSEEKNYSFEDTRNTGVSCSLSERVAPNAPEYVDYIGNSPNFEYSFNDLPSAAIEGTIGYWKTIKQPVYFKNGGWYDFSTNTKQELTYEFSDHSVSKLANVAKTGGTFSYIVRSVLNNNTVDIVTGTGFDNLVSSTITNNQDGTFSLVVNISPTVYTTDVEIPLHIYQKGTGKVLDVVFTVAAGDTSSNIVFDNDAVKTVLLNFDTDSDGELSYDEALVVTKINNSFSNIVGTNDSHSIIDFRVFPNLLDITRANMFYNCNYIDIILPSSLTTISSGTTNTFRYMGGNKNTLVCMSVVPPKVNGASFSDFSKIYVPDIALDNFKNYTENSVLKYPSAKIFPISEIDDNALRAKLGLEPLTENEGE